MLQQPLISVIIPAYNEEQYLPLLLQSLRKQTYPHFEIIVADAHSTDKTRAVAKKYNTRVVEGGSPAVGRNRGAAVARGEYFIFLDADALVKPTFVAEAVKYFDKEFFDVATFSLQPISRLKIDRLLFNITNAFIALTKRLFPHGSGSALMCTRRIFRAVNGFDESIKIAEDHEFVKKCSTIGKFGVISNVTVRISVRRLDTEGRMAIIKKYLAVEAYRALKGKINKDVFKYEFGNFREKNLSQIEKRLEKILRILKQLTSTKKWH